MVQTLSLTKPNCRSTYRHHAYRVSETSLPSYPKPRPNAPSYDDDYYLSYYDHCNYCYYYYDDDDCYDDDYYYYLLLPTTTYYYLLLRRRRRRACEENSEA